MKSRKEHIDSLTAELKEWEIQIDHLDAKKEAAADDAKARYADEVAELRAKQQQAAEQLRRLQASSGDAWESAKKSSEKVWADLRAGLSDVIAKFK